MPLHWYDLLVLVVLGLIIFGPKKLPEMGSSLGKTIREFQKSMREVTNPEPPSSISPSVPPVTQAQAPAPQATSALAAAAQLTLTQAESTTPAAPVVAEPVAAAPAEPEEHVVEEQVAPLSEENPVH